MTSTDAKKTKDDKYKHQIKNTWCIPYFARYLNEELNYNITGHFECRYKDTCRQAHAKSEIVEMDHIKAWRNRDKSTVDLLAIKKNIIQTIMTSKDSIIDTKYRSQLHNIESMSFDELLHFWFDITCFHRRLAKELPSKEHWTNRNKPNPVGGFFFKNDVPKFFLDNEEDVWSLQRTLRMCEKHVHLSPDKLISIKDICCGDINCKEGVHSLYDLVCIDNLLTGTCKCLSEEEIEGKKSILTEESDIIQEQLDDPKTNKKLKNSLIKQYNDIVNKYNTLIRKKHLTDQGLIPLMVRIEKEKASSVATVNVDTVEIKKVVRIVKKVK
jgi:hypothetical protein